MREDLLVLSLGAATIRTNDITYPLTEEGWKVIDGVKTATFYTTLDMGFDRNYVTRYKVEVISPNRVRIDGINFYKEVPSLSTNKTVKSSYLDANQVVVKKGQTLYSIARECDTTVAALKELNHKQNNLIQIGEVIKVY